MRLMSAAAAVQVVIVSDAGPVCQAMCSRISATSHCPAFKQKRSIPCSIWPISPSARSWEKARILRFRGVAVLKVTHGDNVKFVGVTISKT